MGIRQGKQVLRLKYLIYQDLRGKLHYQIKEFSYGQGSLLEILRLPYKRQKISHFTVSEDKDICRYIRQQLYYQNLFWMKEQAEAYQKGENILTYGLKEWYPQIRPIVGKFFQIEQDLTSYYQHFYTYYQKILKMIGKALSTSLLSAIFLEKYGRIERMEESNGITKK